ncbi:hypothetical protein NUG23_15445, partial [Streptomyces sp. PAL114]|nr:hypothetical protein [Streptomyces sp. PAL114]
MNRHRRPPRRAPWIAGGAAVLLLGGVGVWAWVAQDDGTPSPTPSASHDLSLPTLGPLPTLTSETSPSGTAEPTPTGTGAPVPTASRPGRPAEPSRGSTPGPVPPGQGRTASPGAPDQGTGTGPAVPDGGAGSRPPASQEGRPPSEAAPSGQVPAPQPPAATGGADAGVPQVPRTAPAVPPGAT